jgi:hypothetical protein
MHCSLRPLSFSDQIQYLVADSKTALRRAQTNREDMKVIITTLQTIRNTQLEQNNRLLRLEQAFSNAPAVELHLRDMDAAAAEAQVELGLDEMIPWDNDQQIDAVLLNSPLREQLMRKLKRMKIASWKWFPVQLGEKFFTREYLQTHTMASAR